MANIEKPKFTPETEPHEDFETPEQVQKDTEKMAILGSLSDWMNMLDEKDPDKVAGLLESTESKDAERIEFLKEVASGNNQEKLNS